MSKPNKEIKKAEKLESCFVVKMEGYAPIIIEGELLDSYKNADKTIYEVKTEKGNVYVGKIYKSFEEIKKVVLQLMKNTELRIAQTHVELIMKKHTLLNQAKTFEEYLKVLSEEFKNYTK